MVEEEEEEGKGEEVVEIVGGEEGVQRRDWVYEGGCMVCREPRRVLLWGVEEERGV